MSTTVTYKGSTLTTVENATKKLTTQGTWLEDDITITDVTSGGGSVIVVDTPDSHGGTIREITAASVVSLQNSSTVTPTSSQQTILPSTGYDGFRSFVVDPIPSEYIVPSGSLSITENGTYNVEAFARAEVMVQGGGGGGKENEIIEKTISGTYVNSEVTTIGDYLFRSCNYLISVNFSNVTTIGSNAFDRCSSLATVSFPNATSIGSNAFCSCSSLETANFPKALYIGSSAFSGCYALESVSFPSCTVVHGNAFAYCSSLTNAYFPEVSNVVTTAFQYCSALTNASFPKCTIIYSSAFQYCSALESVSFPVCTHVHTYAFRNCVSLKTADFPEASTINGYAFISCSTLESVNLPKCYTIGSYAFQNCNILSMNLPSGVTIDTGAFTNCRSLSTVIISTNSTLTGTIRSSAFSGCWRLLSLYLFNLSTKCFTLSATNAFTSTPISTYTAETGGVYGSVFVPASQYDVYISATNWATYSARIVSLTSTEVQNVIQYGRHDP